VGLNNYNCQIEYSKIQLKDIEYIILNVLSLTGLQVAMEVVKQTGSE